MDKTAIRVELPGPVAPTSQARPLHADQPSTPRCAVTRLYQSVRPLVFRSDPEQAHTATIAMLGLAGNTLPGRLMMQAMFATQAQGPVVEAFGLTFRNPLGMAAGYDKNATGWRGLALLGFGHVEVGTVTPKPQIGNPKPRVFRLVEDEAVINRMGFNNQGAEYLAKRLGGKRPEGFVLGVNIGKNKTTPNEESLGDYLSLLRTFAPLADYLAINVSSPNTPTLRSLQAPRALHELLEPLAAERAIYARKLGKPLPLLVKLAPDLSDDELYGAIQAVIDTGMDGVILSNTTVGRAGLRSSKAGEMGGLSGTPIRRRATEIIRTVYGWTSGRLPIVASGGVMTPADAAEKIDAGATLVQLYTGLIYSGPGLVKDMLESGLLHGLAQAQQPAVEVDENSVFGKVEAFAEEI